MPRSVEDARRWVRDGTELCRQAVAGLDEQAAGEPSGLPGWSRGHLVAHLAANADALGRLVHWAATGEPTPMYSSAGQRAADIERGSRLAAAELAGWFDRSATRLGSAMDALTAPQWEAEVRTAQGRTVPASEIPWLRAREVLVHAVDLGLGVAFEQLPHDFLAALVEDVLAKRGPGLDLVGSLPARAAYLTGRSDAQTSGVTTPDGAPAPALPPWL